MEKVKIYHIVQISGILSILSGIVLNPWLLAVFTLDGEIETSSEMILLVFDTFCILVGIGFWKIGRKNSGRLFASLFAWTIFIAILCLVAAEISLRFLASLNPMNYATQEDKEFGWISTPGMKIQMRHEVFGNIAYTTNELGFREFGDVSTRKPKIMVLGDSYTQAREISDGKVYYDFFKPEAEVFSYGVAGYGTLQEYMAMDKYFDIVKPDIVILQFCTNDFINNSYELEVQSFLSNPFVVKPYWQDGMIVRLFPGSGGSFLHRLHIVKRLRLFYMFRLKKTTIEQKLTRNHPLFLQSIQITSDILKKIKDRCGTKPVIVFGVDENEWTQGSLETLSQAHNLYYAKDVLKRLADAQKEGLKTDFLPQDAHWNESGHKIAGRYLMEYMKQTFPTLFP